MSRMIIKSCYICHNLRAKNEDGQYRVTCSKKDLKLRVKKYESLEEASSINKIKFFSEAKDCKFYNTDIIK